VGVSSSPLRRGSIEVAGAAVTWGTWGIFVRESGLEVWAIAPIVFAVMGITCLPLMRGEPAPRWDRSALILLVLAGLFDGLNVLTYFAALSRTTIAVAVLTHYMAPILVALFAPLVEGGRVPGAMPAALAATAGLALVLEPWNPAQRGGDVLIGAGLGAASAVFYAANVFVAKRLGDRIGAARVIGLHSFVAAALLLPAVFIGGGEPTPRGVGIIVVGAILPGAMAGLVFVRGLMRIGSARAAVLTFFEPLVAVLVGWLVWAEPVGVSALGGAALIVGAGVYVSRGSRSTGSAAAPA
jgi:drug/metabolite transporter (DMT)-like permease